MSLRIVVYYAARGDCILVQFPDKRIGLVDSCLRAGETDCPALADIKALGGKLEFVCLTHPHRDHYSGLCSVFRDQSIQVEQFWDSQTDVRTLLEHVASGILPDDNDLAEIACQFIQDRNQEIVDLYEIVCGINKRDPNFHMRLSEFQKLACIGGVEVWSLSPSERYCAEYVRHLANPLASGNRQDEKRANKISIVLCLRYAGSDILLGGDAPAGSWQRILHVAPQRGISLSAVAVKAPHHGASETQPELWINGIKHNERELSCVISAGDPNHPSEPALSAYKDAQARVYVTGSHGEPNPRTTLVSRAPEGLPDPVSGTLTALSYKGVGHPPCCGDVTIDLLADGTTTVQTQFAPVCGICG